MPSLRKRCAAQSLMPSRALMSHALRNEHLGHCGYQGSRDPSEESSRGYKRQGCVVRWRASVRTRGTEHGSATTGATCGYY